MTVALLNDHIQTVVGTESLFVATRFPSLLNATTEIPWGWLFDLPRDDEVGGLAGCGAVV